MGFFSNLFKRKPGGTLLGNLARGVLNKATGGILGNGSQLAKWEREQAEKQGQTSAVRGALPRMTSPLFNQPQKTPQQTAQAQVFQRTPAYQMGSELGAPLKPYVDQAKNSESAQEIKKTMVKDWLKENAFKLGGALVGLSLITFLILRQTKKTR